MPTLVSDGIKNGKQKGPGTDASMITAMKRNRAVLNGLTSEKFARDPFQLAVTSTSGNGTTMTYNFAAQNDIPFAENDGIVVTGSAPTLAGTSSTIATVSGTMSAVTAVTNGSPQVTAPTTGLTVGMVMQVSANYGGLLAAKFYVVNTIVTANSVFTVLEYTGATNFANGTGRSTVTTTGATGGSTTISTSATIATLTFSSTGTVAFSSGDSVTVSGHSVSTANGYNSTYNIIGTPTITTIVYQTGVVVDGTSSTTTIRHNSSRYNGTFAVASCAADSLTVLGTGVLTLTSTATISGFRRVRTKPIVDSINSRGYLVSGVLPVLTARGMNLSFFPVS